jgi:toxin YoeB
MNSYVIRFSERAKTDLIFFKYSGNKNLIKKATSILEDISKHPYLGIGKPEALKHELSGKWSRRINNEHRLVYEVIENNIIVIHSLKGHY